MNKMFYLFIFLVAIGSVSAVDCVTSSCIDLFGTGTCVPVGPFATPGASCSSDGNACTTDVCGAEVFQCLHNQKNCDDGNPSTFDNCNTATGDCTHGSSNQNGDPCVISPCIVGSTLGVIPGVGSFCLGGTLKNCDDSNPFTEDSCDGATGNCVNEYDQSPSPCDDGNACTTGDISISGIGCVGGQALNCDDNNPFTDDSCDVSTGCVHTLECIPSPEVCDGVDNDCDGAIDEDFPKLANNQKGLCLGNTLNCVDGELHLAYEPVAEICDNLDNNCNGQVDEDSGCPICGDGYCSGNETCSSCPGDCGACPPTCTPSAEICDGLDNDCDVNTLDGSAEAWLGDSCDGADADSCKEGIWICSAGTKTCSDVTGNTEEICADGLDNDCDGTTDEGCSAGQPVCGDQICVGDETCSNCPGDCGACEPEYNGDTIVGGTIYEDVVTNGIVGANVEVICSHDGNDYTQTTASIANGQYSVLFQGDECEYNDAVTVNAQKDALEGTNDGSISMTYNLGPGLTLNVGIVNVALIPEFGIFAGTIALVGALGIFLYRREIK